MKQGITYTAEKAHYQFGFMIQRGCVSMGIYRGVYFFDELIMKIEKKAIL